MASRYHPVATALGTVTYIGLPLVVALVVSLFTSFGSAAHPAFYTTSAQVLPLLLVASLVEDALGIERIERRRRSTLISSLIGVGILFVVGEGCTLYAIAAQTSTTFLLLIPALIGLVFVSDIVASVLVRLGAFIPPPDDLPALLEARLEREIDKRRAKATELASSADALETILDAKTDADESQPG